MAEKREPKVEEFMEIGGSPVPGITLRQILRGPKAVRGLVGKKIDAVVKERENHAYTGESVHQLCTQG